MNEFGTGKVCRAHFKELTEKYGGVTCYSGIFLGLYPCSHLECDTPAYRLIEVPEEEREHYGKKETKSFRKRHEGRQEGQEEGRQEG